MLQKAARQQKREKRKKRKGKENMWSSKNIISIVLALVCTVVGLSPLQAQEKYPSRAIDLVIPFPPGGPSDIGGRLFAAGLKQVLNSPITIVNKPGANGTVSGAYVLTTRKDGYTLLSGGGAWLVASLTMKDVTYDPLKDFIPISHFANTPIALFVREDSPFKTLEELIDKAKKNPNTVSVGHGGGTRGDGFLNYEIFRHAAGLQFKAVPYAGDGPLCAAVLGGHVDFGASPLPALVPFLAAKKLRGLVITSTTRLKEFPDIPSFKEKGFTQTFINNWQGLFAPAGVPKDVVDTLIRASDETLKSKEVVESFAKVNFQVERMNNTEFRNLLDTYKKFILEVAQRVDLGS
jgi:tripartite-type tricarboxylate transporter receptor subunit TctC